MTPSDRDIRETIRSGRVGIEPFDPADVQPSWSTFASQAL